MKKKRPPTWPTSLQLRTLIPQDWTVSLKLPASEQEPRCGRADCAHDLCLIPSAVEVGACEATALMVVVGPSTTATIDGTNPRCAISCAASHDVLTGKHQQPTQKPPGLDDSRRHNQFEQKWLELRWLRISLLKQSNELVWQRYRTGCTHTHHTTLRNSVRA